MYKPNPQSPIPNPHFYVKFFYLNLKIFFKIKNTYNNYFKLGFCN